MSWTDLGLVGAWLLSIHLGASLMRHMLDMDDDDEDDDPPGCPA